MRLPYRIPPAASCPPAWADWLADILGLADHSAALPRTALARCLLLAAALGHTLSAVARRATGRGREVVRRGVRATLPDDPRALEGRLAAGLRHHLPRRFRRRPVPIAIDLHRRPYYGDPARTGGVTGGKRDRGTSWGWAYATAVALVPGHRHTLAVTAVARGDTPADLMDRLLAPVGWAGVRVRYVLLDRGFYSVGVIQALHRRRLRFVIPVPRRGQEASRFFRRGTRGWFDHTVRSHRTKQRAPVRVAVVPGPDGRRPLVFACAAGFHALPRVVLRYGRRFGIETSYRQLGECLGRTTSREAVYRLLLVGVSLLIRAVWIGLAGPALGAVRWDLILALTPTDLSPAAAAQLVPPKPHPTK